MHHSLQKTIDLLALGELVLVFVLHLLSIRAQILAYGCAGRVHELIYGPRGQSVNKHLIRDLPPGPLCAHYGPKGRPVNQYSSHNKNSATFNILQKKTINSVW